MGLGDGCVHMQRPTTLALAQILALAPLACGDTEDARADSLSATGLTSVTAASGVSVGTSVTGITGITGASDGTPTGTGSESEGAGGSSGEGGTGPKLDIPEFETDGVAPCSEYWKPETQAEIFQYIWIANSAEGTVSKIDTQTRVELGRYATNPIPNNNPIGGPSRTSVSVLGDVAVADRRGFLVKFHALEERCTDKNNNGKIDTSTSAVPLPYGQDECLAWSVQLKSAIMQSPNGVQPGPRVAQWTSPSECNGDDSNVWVAWCDELKKGRVQLHSGKDGAMLHTYDLGLVCDASVYGPYGGVVDDVNDLWVFSRLAKGNFLYRVAYGCDPNKDMCITKVAVPNDALYYGINMAADGAIWLTGYPDRLVKFDPMMMGWSDYSAELSAALPGDNLLRGLVVDESGIVWIALGNHQVDAVANPRLIRVDPNMKPTMIQTWGPETIKELLNPVGMSLDVEGYLWMVDSAANMAYKIDRADPASYTVVGGLVTPYTYSDMTGYALSLVVPQ